MVAYVICVVSAGACLLLPLVAGINPQLCMCLASTKHEEALQQRCLLCFSTQPCQGGSAHSCTSSTATLLHKCSHVPAPA
jgi:hypothetical protein